VTEFEEFGAMVKGESSAMATGHDGLRAVEVACRASKR
jgi:hypothetical protein